MTREYMVVYERGATNWSAFVPDLLGCGSLGESLEDTRVNVREVMELYLSESAKAGEAIPEAATTKVDFNEFDPDHEAKQYFVEWLAVSLPQSNTETRAA